MTTLLLTPAHLAGAIVTATVTPPDGAGPPYYVLDVLHPDRPDEHLTVSVEDSTTAILTPRQANAFRRALGTSPEPPDVERALDDVLRGRGGKAVTVRLSPDEHRRYSAAAGGSTRIAGWLRELAAAAIGGSNGR